jgi:NUMOD3 motif
MTLMRMRLMKTTSSSKYYIYLHKIGDHVFYVGSNWKGCNQNRAWQKSGRTEKWYDKVFENDGKYEVEILCYLSDSSETHKLEMKLINAFHDIGQAEVSGEDKRGHRNPFFNKTHSENFKQEQSIRYSERHVGENNPMYGKGYKISGEKNGFYGKKHTEEVLKNIKDKLGQDVRATNNNETLVYNNKKSAYNDFVEKGLFKQTYGSWKYKIRTAIKDNLEFCGYYWEELV